MIRRFSFTAGLISLLIGSPMVHASVAPQVQDLQSMETDAYKLATRYFMYTVTERSPDQHALLDTLKQNMQNLVDQAHDDKLTAAWTGYRKVLETDPYDKNNLVSEETLTDVDKQIKPLIAAIQNNIASAHTDANGNAALIFKQSILMERLTAEYLRRATDAMGGSIVADTSEEDPEAMAVEFSKGMTTLLHNYQGQSKVYSSLWSADRYWNFIKGRMIDFNSKSVPYIVSTFNDNITNQLATAYQAANH
ncbi:MAG: hypothetical protein HKM02_12055 [Pseudomonadales bacterium]|nr:hypothetical protein [Pseudomonadales bacterium]